MKTNTERSQSKNSETSALPPANTEVPAWATTTPEEYDYQMTMADGYSGDIETIRLSRDEYVDTKVFVAGLRGFSFTPFPDDKYDGLPEWLNHTPEEPKGNAPGSEPYYTLNMCDGTGDVPQGIDIDRAEFVFLKHCLVARRDCTPTTVQSGD